MTYPDGRELSYLSDTGLGDRLSRLLGVLVRLRSGRARGDARRGLGSYH